MLNGEKTDVIECNARSIGTVLRQYNHKKIPVILIKSRESFNGSEIRHIEIGTFVMRLDVHGKKKSSASSKATSAIARLAKSP